MEPGTTAWERLSHGFQLSSMLQYYSSLPFNITSGVTTVQGTAGRPIVDGEFIPRNAGIGSDFFSVSLRLSRAFRIRQSLQIEGLIGGVQPDQSPQRSDTEHELRPRRLSDESLVQRSARSRRSAIREAFNSRYG